MIAKLPDDLAGELERNGDRPLTVENPRTNKLYVLLAMDRFQSSAKMPSESQSSNQWTEDMNARRFELIRKEIFGELSLDESAELARLQYDVDAYLQRVAPLPWDALQKLHGELLKKAADANGSSE